jgi:hypothetical protein
MQILLLTKGFYSKCCAQSPGKLWAQSVNLWVDTDGQDWTWNTVGQASLLFPDVVLSLYSWANHKEEEINVKTTSLGALHLE